MAGPENQRGKRGKAEERRKWAAVGRRGSRRVGGPFPLPGFFLDDPENEKESKRLGEDSAPRRVVGAGGTRKATAAEGRPPKYGDLQAARAAPTGRSV